MNPTNNDTSDSSDSSDRISDNASNPTPTTPASTASIDGTSDTRGAGVDGGRVRKGTMIVIAVPASRLVGNLIRSLLTGVLAVILGLMAFFWSGQGWLAAICFLVALAMLVAAIWYIRTLRLGPSSPPQSDTPTSAVS